MALDIYQRSDIRQNVIAGLVLCCQTWGEAAGGDVVYMRGAVAAFQHQACAFGLSWAGIVRDARATLGDVAADVLVVPGVRLLAGDNE